MDKKHDEKQIGWVYIWTNMINNKKRIGHTTNLEKRIWKHLSITKSHTKYSQHPFYCAIRKYGLSNFVVESWQVPINEMCTIETEYKKLYQTTDREFGYDLLMDEKDLSGKNNPMYGYQWSTERKKQHSARMSGENHPNWGKPRSQKTKEKMRKPHGLVPLLRGNKNSLGKNLGRDNPAARAVLLISPSGEEFKLDYYSTFCREHHLCPASMCFVLQGKQKSHKGWTGRYLENTK